MRRLKYAAIWLLDAAHDLLGHWPYRVCHWIGTHPWWGKDDER